MYIYMFILPFRDPYNFCNFASFFVSRLEDPFHSNGAVILKVLLSLPDLPCASTFVMLY